MPSAGAGPRRVPIPLAPPANHSQHSLLRLQGRVGQRIPVPRRHGVGASLSCRGGMLSESTARPRWPACDSTAVSRVDARLPVRRHSRGVCRGPRRLASRAGRRKSIGKRWSFIADTRSVRLDHGRNNAHAMPIASSRQPASSSVTAGSANSLGTLTIARSSIRERSSFREDLQEFHWSRKSLRLFGFQIPRWNRSLAIGTRIE